ncbi:hypothetical protein V499_01580 [Pseudogymnoascus sp. VKM F-103]|uniref:GTPase-activating protein n=1 Tax=Pseudogymnoascus verrucosus TaxID=342668 RepID=A0A1B8G7F7_9PEZI|nr:uncharacterized protein VE01_10206 [Pseudogymnoascus verrucosus]KFY79451.1 hypothetical protein V499_01580 [Pseudogymnoascus sp. VKM F-103]OBT91763.1 hypothetical protein VE01_10206 [Pseudogymnoascus verrucosus]
MAAVEVSTPAAAAIGLETGMKSSGVFSRTLRMPMFRRQEKKDVVAAKKGPSYWDLLFRSGAEPFDWVLLGLGTAAALGAGVPFPLLGILFGELVDNLDSTQCAADDTASFGLTAAIQHKVLLVVYVTIANFVLIYAHTSCWSILSERIVRRLRKQYLAAILRQELAFFDTLASGEVASRLDADLQAIQTGTCEKVGICISSFSYFLAAYVVAFIKAPALAGMLMSIVPAFLLMALGGGHWVKKYASAGTDHVAAATGVASAGLSNMTIVHAFGANSRLERMFAEHLSKAQVQGIKKSIVSSIQLGLLYFIAYSANALAFWQGSKQIANAVASKTSGTSVGAVYTVIFILVDASFIISQVAPFLQLFATAAVSYGKVVETIDRPSRIDGTSDEGLVLPAVAGEIELRNVGFAYPSRADVPVIHDLSLVIPANKHTGIVGLSGSGKSTLAALIGRLYDPISGEVLIDGHNLRDVNVRSIRRHIGTVAQNSSLFDRSVLENIAHGLINSPSAGHAQLQDALVDDSLVDFVTRVRRGKTVEEVLSDSSPETRQIYNLAVAAAEDANALRFIENFQYGFATSVGSTGSQLSGGQKQRVVLARALIRQPSILILDEATASLDSISERIVQEALERVTDSSRTTITIAHRLSTIKKADNIVVMRDGRIIEQGPHAELLGGDGPFATMVRLQNAGTVADDAVSSRNMSFDIASADKPNAYGLSKDTLVELPLDDTSEKPEESKLGRPHISNLAGVLIMGRPYIGFILLGVSAAIIVGGSYSAEAVIFGKTVGELSACKEPSSISSKGAFFGLMFFVLALIEFCANMISTASFGRVAEKMLTRVRILCLRFLFRQDIQWHEEEERTPAKLLAYISSDANAMAGLTGTILGVILAILINMIAGIVLAHIVAWKIAVVLLSMIPILLASGYLRLRIAASFHSRHQKAFASSVGLATEAVGSMTTIASYSLEDETLHVYERSLRGPYKATLKAIAHGNFWLAMAYSIGNLVYALAYWWGSRQIVAGLYSPTQFFTTLPALLFSAQSCGQLLSLAPDVSKATVSAGRVLALLQSKPSDSGQSNFHKNPKNIGGSDDSDAEAGADVDDEKVGSNYLNAPRGAAIHFKNVHFNYPSRPSIPVLQGLTLSIPANSFVALVGPSGAGKSTIISLLERFYYPSMGSVTIDARDIARAPHSFRDAIALVPQHSALFEGTLRFNLEIGARPGTIPSMADIEAACRLAHIHDTIMALPLGYETPCGPRGNQFSGGQMQRLAIARALVRKPRLLLLDESTSALDAESEAGLQAALEGATRAVTVVAVAHRMRTVRGADCIFVIDGGVVVEGGRHEELVGRSAAYREMVAHQTLGL